MAFVMQKVRLDTHSGLFCLKISWGTGGAQKSVKDPNSCFKQPYTNSLAYRPIGGVLVAEHEVTCLSL